MLKKTIAILLFATLLMSCSGVKRDAKKAATLTNKSIEKTSELKLKDAEKLYKKSRVILDKYDSHKKKDKFYKVYIEERDKGKK